jgi:hypothetical protein
MVALFLFLMFLPIIVFVFQLWWMLALRFCFRRLSVSMSALATFFGGANVMTGLSSPQGKNAHDGIDAVLGQGMADKLIAAAAKSPPLNFPNDLASPMPSSA